MPMKRPVPARTIARRAGAVVIGIVALDLVATAITLAFGVEFLKR